ncbi:MAG: hypothetical protein LUI87_11410 [Lachnospiraceae bacterium]|nr:hypothetical protein [Lachnospiraceae bacterium]
MKTMKKITSLVLAGAMTASLAGGVTAQAADGKKCTIGVAFYQDSGLAVDATKAYLESLSDTLNVSFTYTVLSMTDEAANLTTVQELISSGVDGIICTMDLGMTSIVSECEAAGVYIGGYLCDYDTSYTSAYEQVFQSDYFVGTVIDGQAPDDVTGGTTFFESLIEYNERAEEPITHVSMTIFPSWAYPSQQTLADQFVAAVEEYNETAETPITVDPLDEETDILQFTTMDSTYFSKHPDAQAIISFAAGTSFVYPTMVQSGVDLKLFTTGFEGGEEENFGSNGTQTFQQNMVTAVESITYPLVLLLNAINGVEFADQPEDAERVSCSQFCINSDEDMEIFQNSIYYTANADDAMFTAEEVLNMTAYANEEATYADLKDLLSHMTIEDLQ